MTKPSGGTRKPEDDVFSDADAWLRGSGWFTRDGQPHRWYLARKGSTLETNLNGACETQRRRDAYAKGRAPKTTGPSMDCYIDASTLRPGGLSIRLTAADRTSTKFVEALRAAGFKAGDHVRLVARGSR